MRNQIYFMPIHPLLANTLYLAVTRRPRVSEGVEGLKCEGWRGELVYKHQAAAPSPGVLSPRTSGDNSSLTMKVVVSVWKDLKGPYTI